MSANNMLMQSTLMHISSVCKLHAINWECKVGFASVFKSCRNNKGSLLRVISKMAAGSVLHCVKPCSSVLLKPHKRYLLHKQLQWNLSKAVTFVPENFGFYREVAA